MFEFCQKVHPEEQLKHNSGNIALGPGALSDTMIFQSIDCHGPNQSQMMARVYVSSLESNKVVDGDGKTVGQDSFVQHIPL